MRAFSKLLGVLILAIFMSYFFQDLLCMSDEDLVYLQLKTRTERTEVNPELASRIRKWNKLDSAIYDHFYQVFNEKIKEFGTDRMAKEVIQLHNGIARVKQECVEVSF